MGFIGAVAAVMIVKWEMPVDLAIAACLMLGALIAAAQGYWVAYWQILSFIVTLAGLFGVNRINAGALDIGMIAVAVVVWMNLRKRFQNQACGIEEEPLGFFIVRNLIVAGALLFVVVKLARFRGLPNVVITMTVLTVIYDFITERATIGRCIYAVGGNVKAARLPGIKTERLTFLAFTNMGMLAALAGLIFAVRLNTATPKAGFAVELDVIAAVFTGGASMAGAVGQISGAVVGAFIMGVMNNGMSIMGIGIDCQQVIKGLVLLSAVIFGVYNTRKQGCRSRRLQISATGLCS